MLFLKSYLIVLIKNSCLVVRVAGDIRATEFAIDLMLSYDTTSASYNIENLCAYRKNSLNHIGLLPKCYF